MSFFGKKFQKSDFDKILELMDALNVPEKTRALLRRTESQTTFLDNGDGSIQYVVTLNGEELLNQHIVLGQERDFTTPDGIETKVTFTLNGETLESIMNFPDGKVMHMNREFSETSMMLYVWVDGIDIKASVTYQAV